MTPEEYKSQMATLRATYHANLKANPKNASVLAKQYSADVRELTQTYTASRTGTKTTKLSIKSTAAGMKHVSSAQDQQTGEADSPNTSTNSDRAVQKAEEAFSRFLDENSQRIESVVGPRGMALEIDDSILSSKTACTRLTRDNFASSFGVIVEALEHITWYEERRLVQVVFEKVESIKLVNSGSDTDMPPRPTCTEGGELSIAVALETKTGKLPGVEEMKAMIIAAGVRGNPEFRIQQIEACAGDSGALNQLMAKKDMGWYECQDDSVKEVVQQKVGSSKVTQTYWNMIKINKRGRKQKRALVVSDSGVHTFGPKGERFHTFRFDEILAIDVHNVKAGSSRDILETSPLCVTIWLNHVEESMFDPKYAKVLKPVGKVLLGLAHIIPGVGAIASIGHLAANVKIPKMNIKLPSMNMPDMPDLVPSVHKPRPKRMHPCTQESVSERHMKEARDTSKSTATRTAASREAAKNRDKWEDFHFLTFSCDHLSRGKETPYSVAEGNAIVLEMAYVVWAAWCAGTGKREERPFWTDKLQKLKAATLIDDTQPVDEPSAAAAPSS
jgi:hypothetical protein